MLVIFIDKTPQDQCGFGGKVCKFKNTCWITIQPLQKQKQRY